MPKHLAAGKDWPSHPRYGFSSAASLKAHRPTWVSDKSHRLPVGGS